MAWNTLCVLLSCLALALGSDDLGWQNDVYTGRHLDALVTLSTASDGFVGTPAILFMYSLNCEEEALLSMRLMQKDGPPEHFMTIAKHNYDLVHKHIWYELDKSDNLKSRFMHEGDECLKVLFFQVGYHINEPFIWQESLELNLLDWAWSFLRVNIDVRNRLSYAVNVFAEGNGKRQFLGMIKSGQKQQVATHFTRSIAVYNTHDIIYAKVVVPELSTSNWAVDVTSHDVADFRPWRSEGNADWLEDVRNSQERSFDYKQSLHWKLAEAELITYKQPIMLKRFTKHGYFKRKIPDSVYKELRTFYDNNQQSRLSEGAWDNMEPAINTDSVQTTMIPLTDNERENVGGALLQVMEQWCNCELEQTAFYGIREYYHGNVLRMHVDNVETHIISSILIIYKDHKLGENWNLEVVDFHGQRRNVSLEEGEMLLYESGTLIHGRPLPYKGHIFANCFLHYKPATGWNWRRYYERPNEPIITNGVDVEPVDVIDTPRTLRDEFQTKDEL